MSNDEGQTEEGEEAEASVPNMLTILQHIQRLEIENQRLRFHLGRATDVFARHGKKANLLPQTAAAMASAYELHFGPFPEKAPRVPTPAERNMITDYWCGACRREGPPDNIYASDWQPTCSNCGREVGNDGERVLAAVD